MNGMIKMYNREKGYGFIHGEDKQDYFFTLVRFKTSNRTMW